jgi:hypothetical protein
MMPAILAGQHTFPELVDRAFGSDQVLVNGIQFSNQYIRVDGDPYWREYQHREGAVCINDQWFFRQIWLRYNLYSSRVEIEYITPKGDRNQLISVPEQMSAFFIEDNEFRRMQMGEEEAAFYQVVPVGLSTCYVAWSMEMKGGGSSGLHFAPPRRKYWIAPGDQGNGNGYWITFHDRKSYLEAFPSERQNEFKRLLKQKKFSFKQATILEMGEMIESTIHLYEAGGEQ